MAKLFLLIAIVMGFLSVVLGAFAAHALEEMLTADSLAVFKTGVQYQMFHVGALFMVAVLSHLQSSAKAGVGLLRVSGYLFSLGIVLFSGSLYVLSITGITILGIITPLGGVAFLCAWILLFLNVLKFGLHGNEYDVKRDA